MQIKKVLIIGAGQMGSGIAHVMAQAGLEVAIRDVSIDVVNKGLATIGKNMDRMIQKGKATEEQKIAILSRINGGSEWDVKDCDVDFAMEVVPENMALKLEIFKKLDKLCPERTIFATNTSSLSVTVMGAVTSRPQKLVGMHFFSPVFLMRLVEVVKGLATDQGIVDTVVEMAKLLGKDPQQVNDYPGFVGNRIMVPMMNEAIFTLFEGVADAKAIDDVAMLGFNHPIGPIRLVDAIGLDTILYVMEILYKEYGDTKYRPCPLLRKYVEAGWLGKKTGRGFYNDYK